VFAGLDVDAVPDFESLAQPFEILDARVVSQSSVNHFHIPTHTS
jgi:hypothetical protein